MTTPSSSNTTPPSDTIPPPPAPISVPATATAAEASEIARMNNMALWDWFNRNSTVEETPTDRSIDGPEVRMARMTHPVINPNNPPKAQTFKSEWEYINTQLPPNYPKPAPPIGSVRVLTCCACHNTRKSPGEPSWKKIPSRYCFGYMSVPSCRHRICENCVWGYAKEGEEAEEAEAVAKSDDDDDDKKKIGEGKSGIVGGEISE